MWQPKDTVSAAAGIRSHISGGTERRQRDAAGQSLSARRARIILLLRRLSGSGVGRSRLCGVQLAGREIQLDLAGQLQAEMPLHAMPHG